MSGGHGHENERKAMSESTAASSHETIDEVPFAELARHERKPQRRRGRPPKATRRRRTTLHLTEAELEDLGMLHTVIDRYFPVSRSELMGVAVSLLAAMVERERMANSLTISDLEGFRSWALALADFMDLRNQKISQARKSYTIKEKVVSRSASE